MKVSITKKVAAGHSDRRPRAVWEADGLPGLVLHFILYSKDSASNSAPLGRPKVSGWRFSLSSSWSDRFRQAREKGDNQQEDALRLASRLQADLRGQYFPTRREALQAIEVALLLRQN